MAMYDVLGLGVASYDLIGVTAQEPQLGIKQGVADWIETGGGPVATALVTLARLGARVCMAGAVGNDGYGERIIEGLHQEDVATSGMQVLPGRSHTAFVLAEPGRDRRTVFWHNDPALFERIELDPALIGASRALHLDTHMAGIAIDAARRMRDRGGLVMIDAERVRPGVLNLLPFCDLVVVAERFGQEITAIGEPERAVAALHAHYGRLTILTCGERGSWCATDGEVFHTPAFATTPIDTTGCGDVFHGALLFATLRGDDPRTAVRFASGAAALKCRAYGGRAGIPDLPELTTWLASK
jgi:sulfofructose kinase